MDLLTYIQDALSLINKGRRRDHFFVMSACEQGGTDFRARITYFIHGEMYELLEAPNAAALAEKIPAFLKKVGFDYPPFVS